MAPKPALQLPKGSMHRGLLGRASRAMLFGSSGAGVQEVLSYSLGGVPLVHCRSEPSKPLSTYLW